METVCIPWGQRAIVALAIGLGCGLVSGVFEIFYREQDFRVFWLASRMLLTGQSPYIFLRFAEGGPGYFSPITAAVITAPFAWLPVSVAGPVFVAVSCGLLVFVVTRNAWWPLLMFASGSLLMSLRAANLTPLVTTAFFVPGAMWLGATRPNAGVAMLAYRPSARAAFLMLAFAAACLIVAPRWPIEWLRVIRESRYHFSPLTAPGGIVLLLAILRWRRPDARILLALAVIPCTPAVYEALPLFVIATRWTESAVLAATTLAGYALVSGSYRGSMGDVVQQGRTVVLWTCYVPALVMILRRPNEPGR